MARPDVDVVVSCKKHLDTPTGPQGMTEVRNNPGEGTG